VKEQKLRFTGSQGIEVDERFKGKKMSRKDLGMQQSESEESSESDSGEADGSEGLGSSRDSDSDSDSDSVLMMGKSCFV
jgi:hypothetical protein